jgi:hypothetical protein
MRPMLDTGSDGTSPAFQSAVDLAPASRAALGLALFRPATTGVSVMIALDAHDRKDQDGSRVSAIEG